MRYALIIMIMAAVAVAGETPTSAVKSIVDPILDVLRDEALKAPDRKEERREEIESLLRRRFDFDEMARRCLGRHWKDRSTGEKKEFVSVFSRLLIGTYIGKIEAYTDETITYDNEAIKGEGKYSIVKTIIATKEGDVPVEYKMTLRNGQWWIYDVVIEGVSFVSTYRGQYNKIIMRESFSGLLQRMKEKSEETDKVE